MNKLTVFIILSLFISGCAVTSKTVRPTRVTEASAPVTQEKMLPHIHPIVDESVAEVHPMALDAPEIAEESVPQQQVKMTYSQITNMIGEFLDIQSVETDHGQYKFSGISENNLVTLELIGARDNISQASMILVYPEDIEPLNTDLNNAMMIRFLRNVAPEFEEWSTSVKDITGKFYATDIGSTEEEEIILGEKIIQILYDKNIDSITLRVGPK